MKNLLMILFIQLLAITTLNAQSMAKKFRTLEVSRELPFSAETVWKAVAVDYGNIANAHPKIIASGYLGANAGGDYLKGEKGAQRFCYFNEKQTQSLTEQIVDWDPENMTFVNRVLEAKKFPINPDNTRATYRVEALDDNRSLISMTMEFRTKPAFMGAIAKGQFKNLLEDYFIAIEHHIRTGEQVNGQNFKAIKKKHFSEE